MGIKSISGNVDQHSTPRAIARVPTPLRPAPALTRLSHENRSIYLKYQKSPIFMDSGAPLAHELLLATDIDDGIGQGSKATEAG
jgi:hypothetical protein